MSHAQSREDEETTADPAWKELHRLGGIAAIVSVGIMILSVAAFVVWPNALGVISTADMFALVQENTLGALTALDLGVSLRNLFSILLYLAFYVALRQVNRAQPMRRRRFFGCEKSRNLIAMSTWDTRRAMS